MAETEERPLPSSDTRSGKEKTERVFLNTNELRLVAMMTILAFFAALISFIVFGLELGRAAHPAWVIEAGLANPTLRIDILASEKSALMTALAAMLIAGYVWIVVMWVDRKLTALTLNVADERQRRVAYGSRPLQALKAAIREGDLQAVRDQINKLGSIPKEEEDYLSPEELAELYGHQDILMLIRSFSSAASMRQR